MTNYLKINKCILYLGERALRAYEQPKFKKSQWMCRTRSFSSVIKSESTDMITPLHLKSVWKMKHKLPSGAGQGSTSDLL